MKYCIMLELEKIGECVVHCLSVCLSVCLSLCVRLPIIATVALFVFVTLNVDCLFS